MEGAFEMCLGRFWYRAMQNQHKQALFEYLDRPFTPVTRVQIPYAVHEQAVCFFREVGGFFFAFCWVSTKGAVGSPLLRYAPSRSFPQGCRPFRKNNYPRA